MSVANIALALSCVLAVVIIVLYKKSAEKHKNHESSEAALQQRCDYVFQQVNEKHIAAIQRIDSLGQKVDENQERSSAEQSALSDRIATVNEEALSAIEKTEKDAFSYSEEIFRRATEYADRKEESATSYTDGLIKDMASVLEERIGILTSILESLSEENKDLRKELLDLRKKLNFYANIEEAAENLNVQEDTDEREKLLKRAAEQILANRERKKEQRPKRAEEAGSSNEQSKKTGTSTSLQPDRTEADVEAEDTDESAPLLDEEQSLASDYMDTTHENVFVTGKAGTGKSFLLDVFRNTTDKSHVVLAPTGIAALNVKGATLHSTFGYFNLVNLRVEEISSSTLRLKSEKQAVLRRVSTIIIDEISMVRADTFDKIDRILKVINKNDEPFGGKQMLIFGDLFQLPPVTKGQEYDYLYDRYGGVFFFHSDAYKAGNFKFIELTKNHRQKGDQKFFEILNRIREGIATDDDIALLNTRFSPEEDIYEDRFVSLFPTKAEAERVNREHINQLESKEFIYRAKTLLDKYPNKNKNFESTFPIVNELRLRLGASVMMVANDPEHRWVNGTLGIVEKLTEDTIYVSFGKDRTFEIHQFEFDEQEVTYANGVISYEKVYSVSQYPVVPAYAITIHKSQGQTYRDVACDIDRCFASGQAYVALSRCASLAGLHLKSRITPTSIKVDREVLDFYREQVSNSIIK